MALTNQQRVGKALEILRDGLGVMPDESQTKCLPILSGKLAQRFPSPWKWRQHFRMVQLTK